MKGKSYFGLWQIGFGVIAILAGLWVLLSPEAAFGGSVFIVGLFIIIHGISDIVFYCKMRRYTLLRPAVLLGVGILEILLGGFLVFNNGASLWTLGTLFALWFFLHCMGRLCNIDYFRPFLPRWQYGMIVAICLIGFVLGMIMLLLPTVSNQVLGVIVGIYLILLGGDALVLGLGEPGKKGKDENQSDQL